MFPSLIEIGSKTAEKNTAQTNRQTEKQAETTKIMATWPWTKNCHGRMVASEVCSCSRVLLLPAWHFSGFYSSFLKILSGHVIPTNWFIDMQTSSLGLPQMFTVFCVTNRITYNWTAGNWPWPQTVEARFEVWPHFSVHDSSLIAFSCILIYKN